MNKVYHKIKLTPRKRHRAIFYVCMTALPILQFCLFYMYTHMNSIIMSFQEYSFSLSTGYSTTFTVNNFSWAFSTLLNSGQMIKYSLINLLCNLVIVLGLALFFSYYAAKRYFASGFFRIILYLPQMFSGVVFGILYKYLATDVYVGLTGELQGLFQQDITTQFVTLLVYNIWIGFGANVLVFVSTMSGINPSIIESAQLDGVTPLQEFFHIYVPMIYPTFITFVVVQIAGVFTNQMNMFTFYAEGLYGGETMPEVFGYYFYRMTKMANYYGTAVTYPQLSALGLLVSIILMLIVTPLRKVMIKLGPSTD